MGEFSERSLKVTKDMGYSTILWSMAYYDYDVNNQPGKDYVVKHFMSIYIRNSALILNFTSLLVVMQYFLVEPATAVTV